MLKVNAQWTAVQPSGVGTAASAMAKLPHQLEVWRVGLSSTAIFQPSNRVARENFSERPGDLQSKMCLAVEHREFMAQPASPFSTSSPRLRAQG